MINSLILEINSIISRIDKGVVKGQEAGDFFANSIRKAKETFGHNSDEWRLLDRWEHEKGYQWHPVYKTDSYAGEKEKNKLQDFLLKLEELMGSGVDTNLYQNEYTFSVSQRYEAYRLLISLIKTADKSIVIVDNYLDDVVFDFLDIVPENIYVRMITNDTKPIFKRLYLTLKEKRNSIDAKINCSSHDRYIIIDDLNIFSFGASINTIGKADFMVHRIEEQMVAILEKVEKWWVDGKKIA